MPFLGLRTIDDVPGGFDRWSFSHASHHNNVTQGLNRVVTFTGSTLTGNRLIINLSSMAGLFVGQTVGGSGIPAGATITGLDIVALNMSVSRAATATAGPVLLTAAFQPIPFFILDPLSNADRRQFLLDHQNSHNYINAALGTLGNDLQEVNFDDPSQLSAWLDLDFTEHQTWMNVTGIT